MSNSTTPRTDRNVQALAHLERYGFENSLDDRKVEWPILCEEIERELSEVQQQRDTLANHVHALAHLLAAANQQFLHSAAVTQDIQDALAAVKGGTP